MEGLKVIGIVEMVGVAGMIWMIWGLLITYLNTCVKQNHYFCYHYLLKPLQKPSHQQHYLLPFPYSISFLQLFNKTASRHS